MEKEVFISGYCRALDQSRIVEAITGDCGLTEVDCGYGHCIYQPNCPIAKQIDELTE